MKSKKRLLIAAVVLVISLPLISYIWRGSSSSAELHISTNVPATVFLKGAKASSPASFKVSSGMVDVMVATKGYAASIQTVLIEGRGARELTVDISPSPVAQDVPGCSYAISPAFNQEQGRLYFLGNRGSSFMSLSPGGPVQNMNADRLAQVAGLSWARDGRFALLRVEPSGEALATLSSPLACNSPSTFLYNTADGSFKKLSIPLAQGGSFSSDSSSVAFGSMENGSSTITLAPLDAFNQQGTLDAARSTTYDLHNNILVPCCYLSPDSSTIAYTRTPGEKVMGSCDLFVLDLSTGETNQVSLSGNVYGVSWSPGGGTLLFEQRDPESMLPTLHAYSTKTGDTLALPLHTYARKVAWYSEDVILAGLPYNIEEALAGDSHTTPDALVYCSVSSGLYATISPADSSAPTNYTDPVIGEGGNALYFTHAMILRRLGLEGVKETIDRFASSQKEPVVLEKVAR